MKRSTRTAALTTALLLLASWLALGCAGSGSSSDSNPCNPCNPCAAKKKQPERRGGSY